MCHSWHTPWRSDTRMFLRFMSLNSGRPLSKPASFSRTESFLELIKLMLEIPFLRQQIQSTVLKFLSRQYDSSLHSLSGIPCCDWGPNAARSEPELDRVPYGPDRLTHLIYTQFRLDCEWHRICCSMQARINIKPKRFEDYRSTV